MKEIAIRLRADIDRAGLLFSRGLNPVGLFEDIKGDIRYLHKRSPAATVSGQFYTARYNMRDGEFCITPRAGYTPVSVKA